MNYQDIKTPTFVIEEKLLVKNLEKLKYIIEKTGCDILLAQKCFSMYHTYNLIGQYISGTTASGLFEAKLGKEHMGKQTHVYSAAYRDDEIDEILDICDHVVFNSFSQWEKYKDKAIKSGKEIGLRINPECSTQEGHAIYDPCSIYSRMGITKEKFKDKDLQGISGLHFHTLCEQNVEDLITTIKVVEKNFGNILYKMKWINFGGGHHITKKEYDIDKLINCINYIKTKYHLQVYIEPGEAVALDTGFLVSTVLDIVYNKRDIAILDASAACHMPDVIEMPYTPEILEGTILKKQESIENKYIYRLAGPTCLAGDIIGDYVFKKPLKIGDRIIFCDMAIYSMVKTNTFNGMNLPSIAYKKDDDIKIIKNFGYNDFKMRL